MTAAAPPLLLPPPSSRPCNQITLLQQQRLLIAIPLMSPHIASLHVCVTYIYTRGKKETRAPPRQRVWSAIQSRLCSRPLHQNLAFMLDSAAPHAIRKSDIIDQSSNSRLFQQTEREKKKKKGKRKTDSNSPVLSSAVADNCAFTSSPFWPRFSVIDEDLLS